MSDFRYAPDLPPETPGIWTVCDGWYPDIYGNYRTGRMPTAAVSTVVGASAVFSNGMSYYLATGGAGQVILICEGNTAGLGTKAYVWSGGVWANRTGTFFSNGTESGSATPDGTVLLQVGNVTLAGSTGGLFQRDASGTGNFAAVGSGAPSVVGGLAISSLNIVLAIGTDSNEWATSDTNTPLIWNSGEATSGTLTQLPGVTTACVALGPDFLVFKKYGIWRLSYVGGTLKWTETLIDREKGAWGPRSVVTAQGKAYFIGDAGVWSFDGSNFERCDYGVWKEILGSLGFLGSSIDAFPKYTQTRLVYDALSQNIFFFAQGCLGNNARSMSANVFYIYNVISKKWGKQGRLGDQLTTDAIYAIFDIGALNLCPTTSTGDGSGGRTFNTDVGFYSSTNDKVEALSAAFTPTNVPGTNYKPALRTSRLGTRNRLTAVTRFTPEWSNSDGAGTDLSTATIKTVTPYISNAPTKSETAQTTVTLSSDLNRADYTLSAPFQSAEIAINCEAVIAGGTFDASDAGVI